MSCPPKPDQQATTMSSCTVPTLPTSALLCTEALPSTLHPDGNLQGVPVEEVGAAPPARRPPGAGALVADGGEGGPDALALAASAAAAVVAHVDGVGAELVLPARAGGTAAEEVPETEMKMTDIFELIPCT